MHQEAKYHKKKRLKPPGSFPIDQDGI